MTDLSKGLIQFEEINISSTTTKAELLKCYGDKLSSVSTEISLKFRRSFIIDSTEFSCWFYFDSSDKISSVKMTPYIDYKSEDWDRLGQQDERRQFCDKWLFERLGEPHKTLNGDIEYSYNSHTISCFSNFDIRDGGNAGYIVIAYK